MAPTPSWDFVDIPTLLQLDKAGEGRFISHRHDLNQQGRIYGGQLLSQAAAAAANLVDGRAPTYLHGLFLRGAVASEPIEYKVESLQHGKRFSSFCVRGSQSGSPVIDAHVSFQVEEKGVEHGQNLLDVVPPPEECLTLDALEQKYVKELDGYPLIQKTSLQVRFVHPDEFLFKTAAKPKVAYWVKLQRPIPEGHDTMKSLATIYLSDYFTGYCVMATHRPMVGARNDIYVASLNHAIWLHQQCDPNEWLLFVTESPHAQSGRGLSSGKIYRRDGALVASLAQEMSLVGKAS